jgi:hypothetical protein
VNAPLLTSVLLGAALGVANAAGSVWLVRVARGRSQRAFMTIVFGGMAARMTALLAAVAAILVAVPVDRPAFVVSLGCTIALGLAAEVYLFTRGARVAGA